MPMRDPDPGFDPFAAMYARNAALRGYVDNSGEVAERLEAEAQAQAHAPIPGGGVNVTYTHDPNAPDECFDRAARLRALGRDDSAQGKLDRMHAAARRGVLSRRDGDAPANLPTERHEA